MKILMGLFAVALLLFAGCTSTPDNPPVQNQTDNSSVNQGDVEIPPLPPAGEDDVPALPDEPGEGEELPPIPDEPDNETLEAPEMPLYTVRDMGSHDTSDNCWVYANGQVYDATGYIGRHPGGPIEILAWCASDVTDAFGELEGPGGVPVLEYLEQNYLIGQIGEEAEE